MNTTGPLAARWAAIVVKLSAILVDLEAKAGAGRRTVGDVERRRPDSGLAETEAEARAEIAGDLDKLAMRLETWAALRGGAWTACRAALEAARLTLETRPAVGKPGPLTDGYKANFATLQTACKAGDLYLLSARRQADGGAVALICAINRPDGKDGIVELELVPIAVMIDGDPYQTYARNNRYA